MNLKIPSLAFFLIGTVAFGCGGNALKHADASIIDGPTPKPDAVDATNHAPADAADATPSDTTDATTIDATTTDATTTDATHSDARPADVTSADGGTFMPGVGSKLIVGGNVNLIGSGTDTCTNQVPPSGDRWCGFAKLSTDLVDYELWVVNVTKVSQGVTVTCNSGVADPNCLRLSTSLYVDPTSGFRVDGFDGDTLTYSEVPSSSTGGFVGNIFAWRPGFTAPRNLTGNVGMVCNGHALTKAAVCIQNPVPDPTQQFVHTAELHAGILDDVGTPLPLVDTLILVGSMAEATAGVQKWGAKLTPDGKSIAWSTRTTDTGTEDLKWQNVGDATSRVPVASNVSQWVVSSDSKKWFWLSAFNYSSTGAPSGTLQSAPYPGGAAPVTIAAGVGDFNEAGTGLSYRTQITTDTGVGNLMLAPDRDTPAAVTMLDQGVAFVFEVTADGTRATYTKNVQQPASNVFLFDLWLSGAAGAAPCALTATATAFLPPRFLSAGDIVAWGRYNQLTQEIQGVDTTTSNCTTRTFASDLFSLTPVGDEGYVFLDTLSPDPSINEATLRYAKVANGALPALGTPIQARAGLAFATLLPSLPAVAYTVNTGASGDGLYVNATLPFTATP